MQLSIDDVIKGSQTYNDLIALAPLGNTKFQTEFFAVNHRGTGRTIRQTILELRSRSTALNHARCQRGRMEIEIRAKKRAIAKLEREGYTSPNDKIRKIEIDIEEKEYQLSDQMLLINDAVFKVQELIDILARLPLKTRAQIEEEEKDYWRNRILLEAKLQILERGTIQAGTADTLMRLGFSPVEAQLSLTAEVLKERKHWELKTAEAAKQIGAGQPQSSSGIITP